MNREYLETARLLIRVAPLVFVEDQCGLKGGTVVNLFLPPGVLLVVASNRLVS
jgi:hypothetical protein